MSLQLETELDYESLDPDVRDVVRMLQGQGFNTTDSGDGIAKFDADGIELPDWEGGTSGAGVAHVVVVVEPADLAAEADRMADIIRAAGVVLDPLGPELDTAAIQASYDPANHIAVIILSGVRNADVVQP